MPMRSPEKQTSAERDRNIAAATLSANCKSCSPKQILALGKIAWEDISKS